MSYKERVLAVLLSLAATLAFAQETPPPAEDETTPPVTTMTIEVGSRSPERSRTDTPVPVDVVPVEEIADESGQLDLGQLLQYVAPSFNSNRMSGSDGSDHIDAATLRGLGPDQDLVLINGKRRHSSSLVYIFGTRGRGNVGTDLNTIPVSAIERIEILRDGAAAQYGSDAIAGVINIVLRKDAGLNVLLSAGAYTAGDGQNEQVAFHYGVPLGARGGVLSLTAELLNRDQTNRATPGEPRRIGDAATENLTFFYNLDMPVSDRGTFYGHGGYNDREGLAGAWYRGGVGTDDIPSRNSAEMYPDGFVPDIGSDIRDLSAAFGYRTLLGNWSMDVSTTYGSNRMEYVISRTLNASIATMNNGISPTRFDAGGFEFMQNTTNLDFSRYYRDWLRGVSVAAGLEYRRENYEIFAGEPGSYADYDGPGGGNAGSQGFPGFQPVDEVDANRDSKAAYIDLEFRTTPRLLLTTALRAEDYSDFGNTVDGKVSFAFAATPMLNLRGSASTGFRAPSLHQRYFSSTFTDFIAGEAADVKLARNDSELARLVGIPPLKEEESVNMSLGFTWNPRNTTALTLDVYRIDIDDRIVLTGGFTSDDADIGDIIREQNLVEARFFTNAIDTQTRGLDVSLSNSHTIAEGQLATLIALNLNETEVQRVNTAPGLAGKEDIYFNQRERLFVEGSAPRTKGTIGADYSRAKWNAGARVSYFGEVEVGTWSQLDDPASPPQHYDARFSTDVHVGFQLPRNLTLTVGGTNIFDVEPTAQDPNETENGALWDNVQMGFNGAAWFVRLNWKQ
ncbi:MAG TPA: TonB-dependent receptor [Thermoanaerobaculia bacterium]|nr:TonB-dependent receptor [Thermoanaerobaculia bacterium]